MKNRSELLQKVAALEPWFYSFDLGGGDWIRSKLPNNVEKIHETRKQMVLAAAEAYFAERLPSVRCLDVGCHEGYFSFEMAKKVESVVGVDIRPDSLLKADLVRSLMNINNVTFGPGNCFELDEHISAPFELTLFLGVLYHLDNPIGALRRISKVTKELCILETQIIDEVVGEAEWGSQDWHRDYKGAFALIDERAEFDAGNAEAGGFSLSLCPSLSALRTMLESVGFKQINVVIPPADGYEQHVRGKRVVVSAAK